MRWHLREKLTLGLIVLIGTALRLCHLGGESLWYDETVSTALAGSPLPELIRHTAGDIHPPGYYLLLRGWLILAGYPTGHADPHGNGLEFAAGFFSFFFGIVLIALVYDLARRMDGPRVAVIAAALIAASPYNIWYSQEVRMYTLGAGLGVVVVYALLRAMTNQRISESANQRINEVALRYSPFVIRHSPSVLWWAIYAVAAAAGMYTLYYFVFLLIPLNLWALCRKSKIKNQKSKIRPWLLANLAAVLLYAAWIPVAWRQATNPPVPPWRTAPNLLSALQESWTALSLGQSAPVWLWPALLLTLALYALGIIALCRNQRIGESRIGESRISESRITNHEFAIRHSPFGILPLATFAPLALILLISLAAPLYHVRYLFTYSPAFYVVLAAGSAWLWRRSKIAAAAAGLIWLAAAGVTLNAFWTEPAYRADDHRAAVRLLQEQWRPGDVVLVNAGWPYTALTTYWEGPIAPDTARTRLTDDLPSPRDAAAPVIITAGHVDGNPGLGWADPRSDFFALPADVAQRQVAALFQQFDRVWHYRIYDTVNDPKGELRAWLAENGQIFEDQGFAGEAFMRVQGFLPRAEKPAPPEWPSATFATGLTVSAGPLPDQVASGETLYPVLAWKLNNRTTDYATSVRLIDSDGVVLAQGPDERPAGPSYPASRWPAGALVWQTAALPIPQGTPPGTYGVELVVYDPASGQPWPVQTGNITLTSNGIRLGDVTVTRPASALTPRPALARFGPVALLEATSPATSIAAGGQIPVELLWQAVESPGEPLVVVVQLLGAGDRLAGSLEAQPASGRYPTQMWTAGELVRDRHLLSLPADAPAGEYRLVVGVYRAADRERLKTQAGLFGKSDHWVIKELIVE